MLKAGARKVHRTGLSLILGAAVLLASPFSHARNTLPAESAASMDTIALTELPREGRSVYGLILQGGPFAYDKDGTVFGNRERILPRQSRGYYREYTVRTPRERSRGARRIVCGGKQPQAPDACFYTSDHYNSFRQIIE